MAAFGGSVSSCQARPAGVVNAQGWAKPAEGPLTDGYGPRETLCGPGGCSGGFHYGTDIGAACDAPIYAARAGTVVYAAPLGTYGHWILIDHGNGLSSGYAHMFADGVLVKAGDTVKAGQNIGKVGTDGASTGCHLHFELRVDGQRVDPDPLPYLANVGITF
ncbi:protein of unknown function [Microbacterium sp. Nx66]|uniref:M23 family metallopeptidase n=1 Tax=Microbacterium sp. Nx66 TaxID=2766784 RepID=UPI0018618C2A|nr:M23 family metallopeptidase [Microbacterium sp. Nx66]CAD5140721.1 protein of unknown function [Microbacterium sp. Nx66]